MARTAQLGLPLVAPAQAQKHVTVNEALTLLDAIAQLRVVASDRTTPPSSAVDGQSWLIPAGAGGAWAGKTGQVAVWSNGGWLFVTPKDGWRLWDEGRGAHSVYDGGGWSDDAVAVSASGAGSLWSVIEADHVLTPGPTNSTSFLIPGPSLLFGVTGRVIEAIAGSGVSSWQIGVAGAADRYGNGLGVALNSYLLGLASPPIAYYAPTPLLLTAGGGSFTAGKVRLALHLLRISPPRQV